MTILIRKASRNIRLLCASSYWTDPTNNTYCYNYCYEVPELTPEEVKATCESVAIYNPDPVPVQQDIRNAIYLVPADHKVFLKYGFVDLLKLSDVDFKGTHAHTEDEAAKYNAENYYVVRIYEDKCYAISRQLVALSALAVESQNPSARPYLTVVNNKCDHSTALSKKYAYELNYKKTNGDYAEPNLEGGWSLSLKQGEESYTELRQDIPVCPKRSITGTKQWIFNGRALVPAGEQMMHWVDTARNVPIILESNLRLYAVWEVPQYKVAFDWNRGSFIDPQDADRLKEQYIPGNRSFLNYGEIPIPIRETFSLKSWVITARGDADGNKIDVVPNQGAYPQFFFDQPIEQDLWVRAE